MRESDDVLDLEDLRSVWGRMRTGQGVAGVVLSVALAVVATCLVFALVLHVYGAVGSEPVDANQGPSPASSAEADAQQRFQNYLTFISFTFAPLFLPVIAVGIAFAGVHLAHGSRWTRIAGVTGGGALGIAIGYPLYVLVGQLAYGEAQDGFYVESLPVTLFADAIVTNALALAVVVAVGSAIAGYAGTLLEPTTRRRDNVTDEVTDHAADTGGDDATTGSEDDAGEEPAGSDGASDAGAGASATSDGDGAPDAQDGSPPRSSPDSGEDSGPASDYQDHGTRGSTPHYDPSDRDWNGRSDADDTDADE